MIQFSKKIETALSQGIKAVGIGKKGSRSLTKDLAEAILRELKEDIISPAAKGAFIGALFIKGITEEEKILENAFEPNTLDNPGLLLDSIAPDAPSAIKNICVRLLYKEELNKKDAKLLGKFIFSEEPGDGARGLAASILRVRYETPDEYEGLLESMQDTLESPFKEQVPVGEPIIQIAEPFDGVDHSNIITPIVADLLQKSNYRVVSLIGRNSGPKDCYNLLDVAKALKATLPKSNKEITDKKPDYGWYINQELMSHAMDRWVEIRREIIKRPFLSTLERFVNPVKADIIIASAFHVPYAQKMLTTCERAGFPGIIIVRNGLEGTTAFPLNRIAKVSVSVKQSDGSYLHNEFEFKPEDFLSTPVRIDENFKPPSLEKNLKLLKSYHAQNKTSYELFFLNLSLTADQSNMSIGVDTINLMN